MSERGVSILLVDDDKNLRRVLQLQLQEEGHFVTIAGSGEEGIAAIARADPPFDLIVTDIQMPGMDGLQLLEEIKRQNPEAVVVLLTAHGDVEKAVRALKAGAFDFLTKPVTHETLINAVERATKFRRLYFQVARQREALQQRYSYSAIVGGSEAMQRAFELVRRAAPRDVPVLIRGDTGTGKELFARALHHNSPRNEGPFVSLNCAAMPANLLESAFFGHEKGSFTGASARHIGCYEEAHQGTLFLDEIGLMDAQLQGKILRVLETGVVRRLGGTRDLKFDVRVVAATNSPLEEMLSDGTFREDLYYRLNVIEILLPPIRKRAGDLPLLVDRLLVQLGAPHVRVAPPAMNLMEAHSWPGNVRELKNVLERALILRGEEERITETDIELNRAPAAETRHEATIDPNILESIPISKDGICIEELEQRLLEIALDECRGNRSRAARFLGLSRHALRYRLKKYGLEEERPGGHS